MKYMIKHPIMFILVCCFSYFAYFNYTKTIEPNLKVDPKSIHYVNDLYMSDARIYNNYLTDQEKKMYLFMMDNIKRKNLSTTVDLSPFNCLNYSECGRLIAVAHEAILVDHPELLSYASYSWQYKDEKLVLNLKYVVRLDLLEQVETYRIERIIDKIKQATKDMNDRQKIIYVYEWIGKNNTYDTTFTYFDKNQTIYNVFLKHNAVCAGFAKASQVIFQNIGIESYGVLGSTTGPHMWNMVKLDGNYYNFDSTIAAGTKDPKNPYFYKGLNQKHLKDSVYSNPNYYPNLSYDEIFQEKLIN